MASMSRPMRGTPGFSPMIFYLSVVDLARLSIYNKHTPHSILKPGDQSLAASLFSRFSSKSRGITELLTVLRSQTMVPRRLVIYTLVVLSLGSIMALAGPLPSALAGFTPTPRPTTPPATTPAPPPAPPPEKEPKDTPTPTVTQTVNPRTATPAVLPQGGGQVTSGGEMQAALLIIILVLVAAGMTVRRLSRSRSQ